MFSEYSFMSFMSFNQKLIREKMTLKNSPKTQFNDTMSQQQNRC